MTKPLSRKTVKTDPSVQLKLKQAIEDRAANKLRELLAAQIDELGLCNAILTPFADTIKKQKILVEKVKDGMVKLKLAHYAGKNFQATRTETPCKLLDQDLLKAVLGDDLDPYKSAGVRNTVKVVKKDGTV